MNKERREIVNVEDKSAELWIKVLSLVAIITLPLIGVIGNSLIRGQEQMNKELSQLNAYLQTHESRISRNEMDIKVLNTEVFHTSRENRNGLH